MHIRIDKDGVINMRKTILIITLLIILAGCSTEQEKKPTNDIQEPANMIDCGTVDKLDKADAENGMEICFAEALEECKKAEKTLIVDNAKVHMEIDKNCRVRVTTINEGETISDVICDDVKIIETKNGKRIEFGEETTCQDIK